MYSTRTHIFCWFNIFVRKLFHIIKVNVNNKYSNNPITLCCSTGNLLFFKLIEVHCLICTLHTKEQTSKLQRKLEILFMLERDRELYV